jgi:adenosylcobinamide-GDP ribazoletransferase
MKQLRADLATGFALLSRLPVGRWVPSGAEMNFARAVWAYPVVGAVLGALGGAVYWLAILIGMSAGLAACWTLGAMLLLGGALHEDGLADTADGFGGGRDAGRKLEIMRDSRIGSFGSLALMVALGVRGTALVALGSPLSVAGALIMSGSLARAAILIVLLAAQPARRDGLAAGLADIPVGVAAIGIAVAMLLALLLLPIGSAVLVALAAAMVGLGFAWLSTRQIGGHTGDVLGATSVVAECVVLSLWVALRH